MWVLGILRFKSIHLLFYTFIHIIYVYTRYFKIFPLCFTCRFLLRAPALYCSCSATDHLHQFTDSDYPFGIFELFFTRFIFWWCPWSILLVFCVVFFALSSFYVLYAYCCQCLWVVFVLCLVCLICCLCLWVVFVLCLVCLMLPVSLDCLRSISCMPNVASVSGLSSFYVLYA
jgi:hypothetical protein